MTEETREILRQHDEANAFEFPRNFDCKALERRASIVEGRLNEECGELTKFEGALYNQAASFSVAVCLHGHERSMGQGICLPSIRFSNFGSLVSITWPELIPSERLELIVWILEAEGFTFLPQDELDCPYDGVMSGKFESWWIRYFDWL